MLLYLAMEKLVGGTVVLTIKVHEFISDHDELPCFNLQNKLISKMKLSCTLIKQTSSSSNNCTIKICSGKLYMYAKSHSEFSFSIGIFVPFLP